MTFRQWAEDYCVQNGMYEKQAKEVVQQLIDHPASEAMAGRWDSNMDDYSPQMKNVLLLGLKHQALAWIDKNVPKAWYRPMFE